MEMKYIVYVIVIILGITFFQKGLDSMKENFTGSVWDTTKETTETVVDFVKDKTNDEIGGETILGMIPCETSESCNFFPECNNDCICNIDNGECKKLI